MSRILAVADIHLHDYAQRNPTDKYRLYQGLTVADNIIDAGKREGCDIIVFAGDILENFLNRPYVLSVLKEFLDKIMVHFKQGYIIWGNHDQDNKGNNSEFNDCCLSVMLPKNLYYADMKETFIDGRRLAFYNWRPEFDLSWIEGKVDVLFTHATISYGDNDSYTSQVLDESKFDLAVCGDIHKQASKGKYRSIGVSQKCKMGDSDTPTAFVIDLPTMQTKWTNLDPNGKLMKFQYSDVREEEGWNKDTNTWTVYKPSNHQVSGGIKEIDIPEWKEIEVLINQAIISNNLKDIHSEVLRDIKDLDSHEVDFDFTITGLRIKNWRSIESFEQYLADGDKILVLGDNGSGKSSYLSAIKYALVANNHYKDFIQFGAKECKVEVDFIYQGKNYTIMRGSKYGLKVEGVDQKYNNKKEFEAEMLIRFPFLNYMDVYFFNSDHPRLIGDMTPERISEIISKFYKLNRLETYHEHSEKILNNIMKEGEKWKIELDKQNEVLRYLDNKLAYLVLPTKSREELLEELNKCSELQKAWTKWNDYTTKSSSLTARRDELLRQRERIEIKEIIDYSSQIQSLRGTLGWIQDRAGRINLVISEGTRLKRELEDLGRQKFCRTCGKPIENSADLESHKKEISDKMVALRDELTALYKELWEGGVKDKNDISSGCKSALGAIQNQLLDLTQKEAVQNRNLADMKRIEQDLGETERLFSTLGPEPPKVELPFDFWDTLRNIQGDISKWEQLDLIQHDKSLTQASIQKCEGELNTLDQKTKQYQAYIKITGSTGLILKEVMEKLANQFSDNQVSYEVRQYTFRGKEHLSLESYFRLGSNRVAYDNCSDGQRTLLDVDFLSKIVTSKIGMLVMDEFLKHLDASNHDVVIDKIKQMNIGCTVISSHMESIAAFNNKKLLLSLNDSGITTIKQS